jgi:hypothetical protein
MVSTHAVGLSEMFRLAMAKMPLGKYRAEMTAPEQSTAGGARALQHIRLVPKTEGVGHVLVVGNANVSTAVAELRTHDVVEDTCVERFRETAGLDPAEYAAFLDEAQAVLQGFSLKVQRIERAAPLVADPTPSLPPQRSRGMLVGFLLGAAFATAAVAWFFLSRR